MGDYVWEEGTFGNHKLVLKTEVGANSVLFVCRSQLWVFS